jgi:hypothetical protein
VRAYNRESSRKKEKKLIEEEQMNYSEQAKLDEVVSKVQGAMSIGYRVSTHVEGASFQLEAVDEVYPGRSARTRLYGFEDLSGSLNELAALCADELKGQLETESRLPG